MTQSSRSGEDLPRRILPEVPAVSADDIASIRERLTDSTTFDGDAAVPSIAEEADGLIMRLQMENRQLHERQAGLAAALQAQTSPAMTGSVMRAIEYGLETSASDEDDVSADDLSSRAWAAIQERVQAVLTTGLHPAALIPPRNIDGAPRLWVAMVGHEMVPGTRTVAFFQVDEPSDEQILSRFADVDPGEGTAHLVVEGVFDLTHEAHGDMVTRDALIQFAETQLDGGFAVEVSQERETGDSSGDAPGMLG
ncbi:MULTISPECIES: hypothetical protein [unclassified Burkholderia]|uniref:hypothetical protein n=1 Tax=unclassified Burkholderia TaxID=2613784 RepID=UPI002AB2E49D|nr:MULTISPECIES: hypothetical protein [unclassified Burkholderia]